MFVRRLFLVLALFGGAVGASAQGLPMIELSAGFHRIEAELAHTQAARMKGLMERKSMPLQRGMLFVFETPGTHCMWMKNTFIPLDVAFIDDGGRIVNIEQMQPHNESNHCATRPVRLALEMNLGWFRQRGLRPGSRLDGIPRLPPLQ